MSEMALSDFARIVCYQICYLEDFSSSVFKYVFLIVQYPILRIQVHISFEIGIIILLSLFGLSLHLNFTHFDHFALVLKLLRLLAYRVGMDR
jgi:hypothetical protein